MSKCWLPFISVWLGCQVSARLNQSRRGVSLQIRKVTSILLICRLTCKAQGDQAVSLLNSGTKYDVTMAECTVAWYYLFCLAIANCQSTGCMINLTLQSSLMAGSRYGEVITLWWLHNTKRLQVWASYLHGWPSTQPGSLHTAVQRKYTQPCSLFSRGTAVWTMGARLCEQWGTAVCKCPAV